MSRLVAVVTGSNKGIGFGIVRALCKQLDDGIVYLTSRNEERGKEAVARLNQEGLQPRFHQLDITDPGSVNRLRDNLKETHGGLDILVNNAAIYFKPTATEPFAVQATVTMATNFTALLELGRALYPLVRAHGRIVNVSSMGAKSGYEKMSEEIQRRFQAVKTEKDVEQLMKEFVECANAGNYENKGWPEAAYNTAKMGVTALTKVQAANMATDKTKEGVVMTCCCPGYVDTDMTSHEGTLTVDEGAITPVYLALLPQGSAEFSGKMYEKKALLAFW